MGPLPAARWCEGTLASRCSATLHGLLWRKPLCAGKRPALSSISPSGPALAAGWSSAASARAGRIAVAEIGHLAPAARGPLGPWNPPRQPCHAAAAARITGQVSRPLILRKYLSGAPRGPPFAAPPKTVRSRLAGQKRTEEEYTADLLARCGDNADNLTAQAVASPLPRGMKSPAGRSPRQVLGWAIAQVITIVAPGRGGWRRRLPTADPSSSPPLRSRPLRLPPSPARPHRPAAAGARPSRAVAARQPLTESAFSAQFLPFPQHHRRNFITGLFRSSSRPGLRLREQRGGAVELDDNVPLRNPAFLAACSLCSPACLIRKPSIFR